MNGSATRGAKKAVENIFRPLLSDLLSALGGRIGANGAGADDSRTNIGAASQGLRNRMCGNA
jgi:hypothetical protein